MCHVLLTYAVFEVLDFGVAVGNRHTNDRNSIVFQAHGLGAFENKALMRIFGRKGDDGTGA
jgi:hypothetical protein